MQAEQARASRNCENFGAKHGLYNNLRHLLTLKLQKIWTGRQRNSQTICGNTYYYST